MKYNTIQSTYPDIAWYKYADGQTWEFVQGEHYADIKHIRDRAYRYAKTYGYKAICRSRSDKLHITFYKLNPIQEVQRVGTPTVYSSPSEG